MIVVSGTALAKSPSREAVLKAELEFAKKHETIVVFDIDYRSYTWKNDDEIAIYYSMVAKNSDMVIGSKRRIQSYRKTYSTKQQR